MDRRQYLAALGTAGAVATAGCNAVGGSDSLSDPTVIEESALRRSLSFTADGDEIANFGVDGSLRPSAVDMSTELSHESGTTVSSIRLRVWKQSPDDSTPARVAVFSPVEGDSSPPPALTLSTPEQKLGTVLEVTDLDDLADETISTLDLTVRPRTEAAATIAVETEIELASGGFGGKDYVLDGRLEFDLPAADAR